ncbi:MAG: beta-propeller domain-containing protein [Planctomycetes bacterium]|nr:beta-propeller domain-containing protein [Planctomycetota bacterium]
MRHATRCITILAVLALVGCGSSGGGAPVPGLAPGQVTPGSTAQVQPEPPPTGPTSFLTPVRPAPQPWPMPMGPVFMAAGAPTAAPQAAAAPRVVEEADVYRIDGNLLYVLNTYRGLTVFDIADLDRPRRIGGVKVEGRPVDMYVRKGGTLVMLVADTLSHRPGAQDLAERFYRGSQAVVADVTSPASPRVTARIDLEGEVADSRIVGDVLYVVGRRTRDHLYYSKATDEASYVSSLDVSSPSAARTVDHAEFPGTSQEIHVDDEVLVVASERGSWGSMRTGLVYVDIRDPKGDIQVRGTLDVPGRVQSRFHLDRQGSWLRVVTHSADRNNRTSTHVVDVSNPDSPRLAATLDIIDREQLHAVRFDGERGYIVTFMRIDPLFIVDYGSPTHPRMLGRLDVSGWSTHIEPRGDRLIAMGVDNAGGPQQASVSIFDVRNAAAPALLSRVAIGSGWSSSAANSDWKAFRVVDAQNLILVPYSYWDQATNRQFNGLQFVERLGDTLRLRGRIEQKGAVNRSAPARDRFVAISDYELQVVDATDRDRPRVTHTEELAADLRALAPLPGGVALRVVQAEERLRVETVSLADPDGAALGAGLVLDLRVDTVLTDHGVLVLLGHTARGEPRLEVVEADAAGAPRRAGGLALSSGSNLGGLPEELSGEPFDADRARAFLMEGDLLVLRPSGEDAIRVYDLSDRSRPRLAHTERFEAGTLHEVFARGRSLHYASREKMTVTIGQHEYARYYLGTLDLTDPSRPTVETPVNVPGVALGFRPDGKRLYTVTARFGSGGALVYSLAVLRLEKGLAYLQAEHALPREGLGRVRVAGERALACASREWTDPSGRYRRDYTLHLLDTATGRADSVELPEEAAVAAVHGSTVFVGMGVGLRRMPWFRGGMGAPIGGPAIMPAVAMMMPVFWGPSMPEGVGIYDLGAGAPAFRGYLRGALPGSLVVDGGRAWLAAGLHGALQEAVR